MRLRIVLIAVSVVALLAAGCGDDGDGAEEQVSSTTTESTTTTESIATTSSVAAEADTLELADLEGSWEATSFTVTSNGDPALSIDVVALGATVTAETDDAGNLTGLLGVPEAFGGGPEPVTFSASFEILDEETMATTFDEEIPPLLTSFTGPFTFDGDTLTITDEEASFDFLDGGGLVSATAVTVLERSTP